MSDVLTPREIAIAELAYAEGEGRFASELIQMIQPALSVDPGWLREMCERRRSHRVEWQRLNRDDPQAPPDVYYGDGAVLPAGQATALANAMRQWRMGRAR